MKLKLVSSAAALSMLLPIGNADAGQAAGTSRPAMWLRDGTHMVVGFATPTKDGRLHLKPMQLPEGQGPWVYPNDDFWTDPIDGPINHVGWAPDGEGVTWFEAGEGRFVVLDVITGTMTLEYRSPADANEVRDRGAWMWRKAGQRRGGPMTLLDPGSSATPAESWAITPPPEAGDTSTFKTKKILLGDRDVSRYVTALAPRPRSGGVVAVRPYSIVEEDCVGPDCDPGEKVKVRRYRQPYVARISNSLRVGKRFGRLGAWARSLAVSAGGTRLAAVVGSGRRVVVYSLPGMRRIASYPGIKGRDVEVSFSPDGHVAVSSRVQSVVRDPSGSVLRLPEGTTWFSYGPCTGQHCREKA